MQSNIPDFTKYCKTKNVKLMAAKWVTEVPNIHQNSILRIYSLFKMIWGLKNTLT